MAFSLFISTPRSLTHPASYHPMPEKIEQMGSGATLFATHDQAILGHQVRLVDRVVEGTIDKDTFLRNVGHLESFETLRADLRGDGGLTRSESATLRDEMKKLAGKMVALPQNQSQPSEPVDTQALGLLFDELSGGAVSTRDAIEELHWRSGMKYGEVVAHRPGPIYTDERPKLRSALATDIDPRAPLAPVWPQGAPPKGTLELIRKGIELFPQLDLNGDEVVDRTEARTILTDYENLGLTASQAATFYSRQGLLAEVLDPGPNSFEKLSLGDLKALLPENASVAGANVVSKTLHMVGARLADQERRALAPEMPLYFPDGPNGSRVSQGLEGSCWFVGALPALDPEEIKRILLPEGDHFRMHFADGTSDSVAPLNEAERRVYSRGDGAWSGLMEKAVAQKLGKQGLDIKGGLTQDALRLLTGADCNVSFLNSKPLHGPDYRDRRNLAHLLETTLEAGGAVFTQVNEADFDPGTSLISDSRHAYTVLTYDAATETATLRNPWGQGEKADRDGVDDGIFKLTLTEMAATFSLVITEKAAYGPAQK